MMFKGLCQVPMCRAAESDECKRPENDACYLKLRAYTEDASGTFVDKPIKTQVTFVYEAAVETGQRYRDVGTGFEGVAISVCFHQHGCPRATLRTLIDHRVVEYTFDAPGLELVSERPVAGFQVTGDGPVQADRELRRHAQAAANDR
jgi:hypothetical protein